MTQSEPSTSDDGETPTLDRLNELSREFDVACKERLVAGAAEYGEFAFLGNDVLRMLYEELFDLANYAKMKFMKLRLLEDELASGLDSSVQPSAEDAEHQVPFGAGSFTPGGQLPSPLQGC
jgi:hypothetical protein